MLFSNEQWIADKKRRGSLPAFQYWFRATQTAPRLLKPFCRMMLKFTRFLYKVEISAETEIGRGLYVAHPYCITINPAAKLGKNCNIAKGVTIGRENRGERKGVPIIGDCVWIGVNATIVGKICVGNDVLIAPNTFVNKSVPDHSIVFGNPCIIKSKDNATEGYINNRI